LIDLKDNGDIEIEFDDKTVTIRPPRYGALKRLDRERERISDIVAEKIAAFDKLDPIPKAADDETDEQRAERVRIVKLHRERVDQINQLNVESMIEMWTFILFGHGEDFKGLAQPEPPRDPDEWPGSLIFDHHELFSMNGDQLVANASLLDRVFLHWKKVRYRPGLQAAPT
jgi:hypothetical protein